ncbi:MAG: maleylacetoacetate isomerase [Comamonadaceae bacterium]|nr:MAG: maleylacetoacetate isomerase [Comamonadaceae bacterium]
MLSLYSYFRSSAAYRVRIALHLKGLPFNTIPVHLLINGGEQHAEGYRTINPSKLIPSLVDGDFHLGQSLTIMEYLEETHPDNPLLPADPMARARVRSLAQSIACDIHPLNNLRVLQYLKNELDAPEDARTRWYQHWVSKGFEAIERMLQIGNAAGQFCEGDRPGMADCCLIPQMYNARRFNISMDAFPTLCQIETVCLDLDAFKLSAPEIQPDAD